MTDLFYYLELFEDHFWGYVGGPIVILFGLYLSIASGFIQIRRFPTVLRIFWDCLTSRNTSVTGIHPIKAFFASVGGCVGVGNIVAICTAVQLGGPGALFWIWVTAIMGMVLKYSEVFLGLRFRVPNKEGSYNGGPMYFLQHAFKGKTFAVLAAVLLCIYGVEVAQFRIVTTAITSNIDVNEYVVISIFLLMILFAGSGGIRRVGNISSAVIPLFVLIYVGMGTWVLLCNLSTIPTVLTEVLSDAFTGQAVGGGLAGSALMRTMSHGIRRGCYTGDLGIGYASIIHSESSATIPEKQATLAIFDIFLDTFIICTTSVMLILVTGVWNQSLPSALLVQTALEQYFPYMHFFMPFFLFLLGYSTINAYFCVGLKCADFIWPSHGKKLYYAYAITALIFFSFFDSTKAQTLMGIAGGLLLVINCLGIYRLRHELSFNIDRAVEPEYRTQNTNQSVLTTEMAG
jgi:alanine or glycine:cation symporter, AGCS family